MKLTYDGFTMEGTLEEIKEMMTAMGAEFPEVKTEEPAEDTPTFREYDHVKALADGEDGDITVGDVGTVDEIFEDARAEGDPYYIGVESGSKYDYFRPQDLELVTEEEAEEKPRTVKRNAHVGERILITGIADRAMRDMTVGKEYEVVSEALYGDTYVNVIDDAGDKASASHGYYEVIVEEKPYKPSEGDIVVITANTNGSRNAVGDIGKVGKLCTIDDTAQVDVPDKPDSPTVSGNWTEFSEMRPATDEEKAEYEKAVKDAEWAKLGRKPGEFKKGDIVRTKFYGILEVDSVDEEHDYPIKVTIEGESDRMMAAGCELIAPVESRVDVV